MRIFGYCRSYNTIFLADKSYYLVLKWTRTCISRIYLLLRILNLLHTKHTFFLNFTIYCGISFLLNLEFWAIYQTLCKRNSSLTATQNFSKDCTIQDTMCILSGNQIPILRKDNLRLSYLIMIIILYNATSDCPYSHVTGRTKRRVS